MTWRGSNTIQDRIFSSLVYLLPMTLVLGFGSYLFMTLPALRVIVLPFMPLIILYGYISSLIPYSGIIIFFALFLLVVRNERLRHFLRFHTMQAILLDIFVSLCGLLMQLIGFPIELMPSDVVTNFFFNVVSTTIFLAVFSACVYSIVQALRGLYAEIPVISDAAYIQVPR